MVLTVLFGLLLFVVSAVLLIDKKCKYDDMPLKNEYRPHQVKNHQKKVHSPNKRKKAIRPPHERNANYKQMMNMISTIGDPSFGDLSKTIGKLAENKKNSSKW